MKVSFIIPTHNAADYILDTLESIRNQQIRASDTCIEISIRDDGSSDRTYEICLEYLQQHFKPGEYVTSRSESCNGPGASRNAAVIQSTGDFLCFNDADDISLPARVQTQLDMWFERSKHEVLIGSRFVRDPPDATKHYAAFLNSLSEEDLYLKSFRELTLIQPTWFMSRKLFDSAGGYRENQLGEDLELFHRLLDMPDFQLRCADNVLVIYRHLAGSVSSKTPRSELLRVKVAAFERRVLSRPEWREFSVWGAGRDGRAFFDMLSPRFRQRIREYVDVSANKINSGFHHSGFIIPVKHVSQVKKPFVVCVAMGRTEGQLEANIAATGAIEGIDYWHFN